MTILQITLAVHRSLHRRSHNKLMTDCLGKEILYNLYPSHTIAKTLEAMGPNKINDAFVIISFCDENDKFYEYKG